MLDWRRGGLVIVLALGLGFAPGARAEEVLSGVATRATPQGLEFAADLVSGLTFTLPSLPLQFTVDRLGCEYHLTIHQYQGEAELGEVHLGAVEGSPDHLAATGSVARLDIWDVVIEATSPDWWCPNYNEDDHDVIVSSLEADDTSFILRASGEVVGNALVLEVLDSSSVHLSDVQVETTQWYLPEELIEAALESFEDEIEQFLLDEAADILGAVLFDLPSAGMIADFAYEAQIADLSIDGGGLTATMDAAVGYEGEAGECEGGTAQLPGGTGLPGELTGSSGDLQLAITEEFANAVIGAAWSGGLLCQAFQHLDFSSAAPLFPALENEDGVRFGYEVTRQPTLRAVAGELQLDLPGVWLELEDTDGGGLLFWADVAVAADVTVEVDGAREVLTLSLLGADLEFLDLDASGLLHGTNYTEEAFLDLLDSQVLLLLPDQLADIPVAPLSFGITGMSTDAIEGLTDAIGGRVLGVELIDGAAHVDVEALLDVDDVPPWVEILSDLGAPRTATTVTLEYAGEDDRAGPLAYSWRVDGGAWSFWGAETTASFVLVDGGGHDFEVRARDAFWNESVPAFASFQLDLDGDGGDGDGDGRGCDCDLGGGPARGPDLTLVAALLGVLALRRRVSRA